MRARSFVDTKDEKDHEKQVAEAVAEIAKLQSKIAQLSLDDSREAIARRAELEEQLAEKQKELADLQGDYQLDIAVASETDVYAYSADGNTWNNTTDGLTTASGTDVTAEVKDIIGASSSSVTHASTHATGGSDPITPESIGAIPSSDKGNSGGVATLDSSGKVPSEQIPSLEYAAKTHASQHASGGSDQITPASIGAAPAGYGLGGGATKIDNLNDAVNNGWYLIAGTVSNGPKESIYGWMLVSSRSGSGGMIRQDFWEATTNPIHYVRYAVNGEFKEWEYVNPPMASGIEYRTTERYTEKAVYKKLDTDGVIKWRVDGETTWHSDKPISKSVTLSASAWDSSAKTQTVTVPGVLADETKQLILN